MRGVAGQPLYPGEEEEAVALYVVKLQSIETISEWFGCGVATVRRALVKRGVEIRGGGRIAAALGSRVGEEPDAVIAARFGVSESTVYRHRKRRGISACGRLAKTSTTGAAVQWDSSLAEDGEAGR